jgi:hypothetical protein
MILKSGISFLSSAILVSLSFTNLSGQPFQFMNILLIEDDAVLADGLIHTLANSGYTGFILDETGTPANPELS